MNYLTLWFQLGPIPKNVMTGTYDLNLVFLSFLVAILASYAALEIVAHLIKESTIQVSKRWLIISATIMGVGIWSMHFIGMLAFSMSMPASYNLLWTITSMFIAIVFSAIAFYIIRSGKPSYAAIVVAGVLLGIGITTMHYMGMKAMIGDFIIKFIPWKFAFSIVIAISISIVAILLLLNSNKGTILRQFYFKIVSALVMGAAICSMHYMGMAAAVFYPTAMQNTNILFHLSEDTLSDNIAGASIFIFIVALIISSYRNLSVNALQLEIESKFRIELERANELLEQHVADRTNELKMQNIQLNKTVEELKNTQNKLIHAEKMVVVGQLVGGIAHEINNPLSYVMSNVNMLQKHCQFLEALIKQSNQDLVNKNSSQSELLSSDIVFNDIKEIFHDTQEGLHIIKKTVANLKLAATDESMISQININECLDAAINILANNLKNKCILTLDVPNFPYIAGNKHQLTTAFVNILLNAIQAIEDRGTINISGIIKMHEIIITIIDNGCGILPEHLKNIFIPFFTTKPINVGSGLGLSMVYNIIKQHNGTVEIESQVGKSTTVTLCFPLP